MLNRHYRQGHIKGNGILFLISTPAVQQVNLTSALDYSPQDVMKLAGGINLVLVFWEPLLWWPEPQLNRSMTKMAKGAGASRLRTDEPPVLMFQDPWTRRPSLG